MTEGDELVLMHGGWGLVLGWVMPAALTVFPWSRCASPP
jgi:hypothetical protein